MIYHLLHYFNSFLAEKLHFYAYQYVMFRSVMAILTSPGR